MAYTINYTDGAVFATIPDGTINTDSSMIMVGKNYAGYGEFLDENFLHLLENSANSTAPGAPVYGQLWYNKTNQTLQVYRGNWKVISGATASSSTPSAAVAGDLWYDSTNAQLKVYSGVAWILVGPAFTAATGTTGAIVDTITENDGVTSHVVIKLYVQDQVVGIVSKDATFIPQIAISGYTSVRPGITLATSISGIAQLFQGTATDSQQLDGLDSTDFLSSVANDTTTGTLGIRNDGGLTVGADDDLSMSVTGSDVTIKNQTADGNIVFQVNDGGVITTVMTMVGGTSNITVATNQTVTGNVNSGNILSSGLVSSTGNITAGNVITGGVLSVAGAITVNSSSVATAIVNGAGNAVGNIGSSSTYFNRIFAQATTALYADVAERFAADAAYSPGTVVELGGSAEVTQVKEDLSENVFGVVSTDPAYLMNGGAGDNNSHPPIAVAGRVPVAVTGLVTKGDRLVSAGNGVARAAQSGEATAFNVIGRALADKTSVGIGSIEAIVKFN